MERSKKKVQLWKRAIVHFSLCFVMGFFTGFAPTSTKPPSSIFSNSHIQQLFNKTATQQSTTLANISTSFIHKAPLTSDEPQLLEKPRQKPNTLIVVVTPMSSGDRFGGVFLRKQAASIKLVPPPLLWIVVERQLELRSDETSEILRKTGIMYRHLLFKQNFTDAEEELDHQRNIALKHIENYRLCGIVHFSGIYSTYDLRFFDELRGIEVFGTWPVAVVSANKKKVVIEGPVCDSSKVIGWHLRKLSNNQTHKEPSDPINVSSFAFNSSILWDPERWGRPSSSQQTYQPQNSMKFVKEVALEDETKLKGITQEDCSKIMLWHFHFPILTSPII